MKQPREVERWWESGRRERRIREQSLPHYASIFLSTFATVLRIMNPANLPTPSPADLPLVDLDAPGESWRVVLVPLGITPRRPRLVSEHETEGDALDAAVRMAASVVGWSVDVLAPLPCEV